MSTPWTSTPVHIGWFASIRGRLTTIPTSADLDYTIRSTFVLQGNNVLSPVQDMNRIAS